MFIDLFFRSNRIDSLWRFLFDYLWFLSKMKQQELYILDFLIEKLHFTVIILKV